MLLGLTCGVPCTVEVTDPPRPLAFAQARISAFDRARKRVGATDCFATLLLFQCRRYVLCLNRCTCRVSSGRAGVACRWLTSRLVVRPLVLFMMLTASIQAIYNVCIQGLQLCAMVFLLPFLACELSCLLCQVWRLHTRYRILRIRLHLHGVLTFYRILGRYCLHLAQCAVCG